MAKTCNAPFISLTETHLNSEILDAEINIPGYTPYRCDRIGRSHGGVCTFVRNDLVVTVLLKDSNSYCDTLVLKIHQMDLIMINFYRPPKCPSNLFLQSLHKIKQTLHDFEHHTKKTHDVVLTTDCNFPEIQWAQKTGHYKVSQSENRSGEESIQIKDFLKFADEFFLYQIVDTPTRRNNILDLVFTNSDDLINNYSVVCNERLSDHSVIQMKLNSATNVDITSHKKKSFYTTKLSEYDFHSASDEIWMRFNLLIQKINFEEELCNLDTSKKLERFYFLVCNVVDIVFEKKESSANASANFSSSNKIPRKVRILMRNKKNLSKSILKSKTGKNVNKLRQKLRNVELQLENHYFKRRQQKEDEAIRKIKKNPKFFYSYAKKFSKIKSGIGPFVNEYDELINDNYTMTEMLRKQYEKSFSQPFENAKVDDPERFFTSSTVESDPRFDNLVITHADVEDAIDSLSASASPGPDCFPAILLKHGKLSLSHALADIFSSSLQSGEVPREFKMAYITPIHKGGSKSHPINYRPVSLTSHLAKTFERIIRRYIVAYLEVNNKMNKNQHGFRNGRSCLSQLLDHYDKILKILEDGGNADCVYLDFSKCFDKIDIGLLCQKLKKAGIGSKMGIWLHNFLVNRKQFVVSEDAISSESDVISGIPQGTVLGPILFLIFISDIDQNITSFA